MRTLPGLALISVFAITALSALSPLAASDGQPCSICHTGSSPSGAYLLKMLTLSASYPSVVPPDTQFNYTLKVSHPGKYTVRRPAATVTVEGAGRPMAGESLYRELPSMGESGGTETVSWSLSTGNTTGRMFINATLQFTARHRHASIDENDENPYILRLYSAIYVRPVALYTTATEISIRAVAGRPAVFDIVSYSDIQNITLTASPNLDGAITMAPDHVSGLAPGQMHTVQVYVVANPAIVDNGRIDIVWENRTGAREAAFVVVRTVGPAAGPGLENPTRWTGRAVGLLSLGLLMTSVVLGYVKWGGKRRVRVHCAVSWFILGLSVYHGLMLVWGPYNRVWLTGWVLLGYISAAVMGVSSVNGLLQDWMTRKTSHKTWIWLHRATLIAAIVLVAIHAIKIGTDLKFARQFLLPEHLGSGREMDEFIGLFRTSGGR